jgi:hypothetical protein
MSGPLSGVRVLELVRILAGPWAGQILADLGADVIKVERKGAGDDTRAWGPPSYRQPTAAIWALPISMAPIAASARSTRLRGAGRRASSEARGPPTCCLRTSRSAAQFGLDYEASRPTTRI